MNKKEVLDFAFVNQIGIERLFFMAWKIVVRHEVPNEEAKRIKIDLDRFDFRDEVPAYVITFINRMKTTPITL